MWSRSQSYSIQHNSNKHVPVSREKRLTGNVLMLYPVVCFGSREGVSVLFEGDIDLYHQPSLGPFSPPPMWGGDICSCICHTSIPRKRSVRFAIPYTTCLIVVIKHCVAPTHTIPLAAQERGLSGANSLQGNTTNAKRRGTFRFQFRQK